MAQVDRYAPALIVGKGTKANIIKAATYAQAQGELAMATDEDRLYVGDASLRFASLCGFVLPWIVTVDDAVVSNNGEVVWTT